MPASEAWPQIAPVRDGPTLAYLHLLTQMAGKLRVAPAPWVNHGWHATLLQFLESSYAAAADLAGWDL